MNIRATDGQGEALDPNDDARPDAGGAPSTPAAAAGTEGEQPAAPSLDPDDAELAAAREALAAEQAAKDAGGNPPAPPAAAPSAPTTAAPAAPPTTEGANQPAPMVPVHVAVAERKRAQQAEREADFLRGQVEALRATMSAPPATPPTTPTTPAAPVAADPIQAEIDAETAKIVALAEKADMGEITFADLEKARAASTQRITVLAAQQALRTAAPVTESLADQAIQKAHEQRLYEQYPYAAALTAEQAQFIAGIVQQEQAALGTPIGAGPAETMRLKDEVAKAAEYWGRRWGVQPIQPAPGSVQQQQNQNPAQPPGLSPDARARMAKMDLAAGLPPDTRAMGSASQGTDLSAAAIEAMDEEAIAALPAATRHRMLGFASG